MQQHHQITRPGFRYEQTDTVDLNHAGRKLQRSPTLLNLDLWCRL
jgi:hypothetical protein